MNPVIARAWKTDGRQKMDTAYQLAQIEKYGKQAKGRAEYIRFLNGERLGYDEAIYARCYECMAFYRDGIEDCVSAMCPLHRYMPYNATRRQKEDMSGNNPTKRHSRP
ncbi:MAG: hypothetical protein LBS45_07040 [Synergistaceae bacterium]|jgi:hypothetical protein|nr:hypothetical protein [Synergistaceae bacterium]